MCLDPATLTLAATATSVIGSAYAGVSAYSQANAQAQVAQNNAQIARAEAADSEERGLLEQQRVGREIASVRSAQIAAMAAAGFDTSAGTAADIVGDTNFFGRMDQENVARNTASETTGYLRQAQNLHQQAKGFKRAGRDALVSTAFKIGGDILGGATQLQNMKLPPSRSSGSPKPYWTPNMRGA